MAVYGRSAGPPVGHTGAPVDGGQNCTMCHRTFPVNSGAGRITISTTPYTPGVKQNITVTVEDPDARRWGFQLTARLHSDESKQAGTFTVTDSVRVKCLPDDRDAPCNGDREFASHTSASTRPGTPGPAVWTVEWAPPATDVGEVIFYMAGNAANNNNTNTGDHIYTNVAIVRPVCSLTAKPTISGISDAASYRTSISPNALISIFGSGFAPPNNLYRAISSDLVSGRLPTQFGCIAVEIDGQRSPVFFVGQNQINAQAPIINRSGEMGVRVILNPGTSGEVATDEAKVQWNFYSPALFQIDATSVLIIDASQNNSIVTFTAPAKPGDIVVLYGTGFGYSNPVWQPGEFSNGLSPVRDPYVVMVGGAELPAANILYAGLSSAAPGLYQFNLKLPDGLADGDAPLSIRIGGYQTQAGLVIPVKR